MRTKIIFILLLYCNSYLFKAQEVLSTSGGYEKSNTFNINWTLGETVIETFDGTNNIISQGMHQEIKKISLIENYNSKTVRIKIYPNPSPNIVILETERIYQEKLSYNLYNEIGNVLLKKKLISNIQKIDLENFEAGVYFLVIISENNTSLKYKIVKF